MFRAHVLIIRMSKLHYTASGIVTPIGGRLLHETATYRSDDTRNAFIQVRQIAFTEHIDCNNMATV